MSENEREVKDKERLLAVLEEAYAAASERGHIQHSEPPATFRMVFEDRWQEQVSELLDEQYQRR